MIFPKIVPLFDRIILKIVGLVVVLLTRFPTIHVGMEGSQSTEIPNQTNKQTHIKF